MKSIHGLYKYSSNTENTIHIYIIYTIISPLKTNGLHQSVGDGPLDIYRGASYNLIFYLKTLFILYIFINCLFSFISSVAPDEMPHYGAFILGFHCL